MINTTLEHSYLNSMITFIKSLGIDVFETALEDNTFLPGLKLGPNCIYFDREKLLYQGDILHEAGHLAVTTPVERFKVGTDEQDSSWPPQGEEMSTILWSYAALLHLNIPIEIVFHPDGYKNESEWMIQNFKDELYIGLPLLEWMGLALSKEKALEQDKPAFPQMLKWVRE